MNTPSKLIQCVLFTAITVLINGCGVTPPRNAVPDSLSLGQVVITGVPDARFWGDEKPPRADKRLMGRTRDEIRADYPAMFGKPHNYLAISGGGADGAYGAGLINGWTESGDRPEFQIVTGVSTGSLIAPWAFLGPSYDEVLKEIFTTVTTKDIVKTKWLLFSIFSDAITDSTPLLNKIKEYVDDKVVKLIATEHAKGRRLFIGTTEVDYMRPVIWDIGAIASSGRPDAKDLIHSIMLASASIPGAFPPVTINVEANGVEYDELHVDGGTTNQVFVYPSALDWNIYLKKLEVRGKTNIYIIRNSQLTPRREIIEAELLLIAKRSISSLIRTQGIGDLNLIYLEALRDNHNFNLAFIPSDFKEEVTEQFDKVYMNKLYDLGYSQAKNGYPWLKKPPYLAQ